jgi:hypothetical protein
MSYGPSLPDLCPAPPILSTRFCAGRSPPTSRSSSRLSSIWLLFNPQTAPYYSRFFREFGATAARAELSETPVRNAECLHCATDQCGGAARPFRRRKRGRRASMKERQ